MPVVDDSQVEELRRWAVGLSNDPRPEVKAAAKAIDLLSDELLAARSQLLEERLIRQALESRDEEEALQNGVGHDLIARVRALVRLRPSGQA